MGIQITNDRPAEQSNWGDNNLTPGTSIVTPPSPQQISGWVPGQQPPAPYMNYLHYIAQRWDKNLDERAPRIPTMKWFVGGQSGAHFPTIAAAMASGSVGNGDWLYVSPSNTNMFLNAAITINKAVKIFFEPYSRFYKTDAAATRALIISASDVEIHGAEFSSGWSSPGDAAIAITGDRVRIVRCSFDSSITTFIDDSLVAAGDVPVLSQNLVEY